MKRNTVKQVMVTIALALALPVVAQGQDFQRVTFGGHVVGWVAPDLDEFSVALTGLQGTEIHEIDDTALFGIRPFVRLGLTRELDLELSHEFAFSGDVDVMVSSASGIWRPFGGRGLELHASICFGQFDWDGPADFDSTWGWEAGAGYNFRLTDSASFLIGVAYRDLSFDLKINELVADLAESRPDVAVVSVSNEAIDTAGAVASAGVLITF